MPIDLRRIAEALLQPVGYLAAFNPASTAAFITPEVDKNRVRFPVSALPATMVDPAGCLIPA